MHETDLPLDDPSGSHLVIRSVDPSGPSELTRRRRGMLTSVSVLVPAGDAAGELVQAVTDWAPPQFRVEFVLVTPDGGDGPGGTTADTSAVTDRLDRLAWSWALVEAPPGGRGPALDRASAESTGEFVVVAAGRGVPSFEPLSDALGHMWVNGGDALVIAPGPTAPADESAGQAPGGTVDRRAERLGAALGITRGDGAPAIVVLRRWVARFLFDDLGRAIDPTEEFADRVRLLELRLIEVLDGS